MFLVKVIDNRCSPQTLVTRRKVYEPHRGSAEESRRQLRWPHRDSFSLVTVIVSANVCYSKIILNPIAMLFRFRIFFVYLQSKTYKTKYYYEDFDFTGLSESQW